VIPVTPAGEPTTFHAKVRQPGTEWLAAKGYLGLPSFPPGTKVKPIWREALKELMTAYDSVCAYSSLRIAPVTGAASVDHFAPKSRAPAQTYEWSNYRLACAKMNARKNNFTNVLDPFSLAAGTFELIVGNGGIRPAPSLSGAARAAAKDTIRRLKLDDPEMRKARLSKIDDYLACEFSTAFLLKESPFIHSELARLGLLRP